MERPSRVIATLVGLLSVAACGSTAAQSVTPTGSAISSPSPSPAITVFPTGDLTVNVAVGQHVRIVTEPGTFSGRTYSEVQVVLIKEETTSCHFQPSMICIGPPVAVEDTWDVTGLSKSWTTVPLSFAPRCALKNLPCVAFKLQINVT